MHVHHNYTHSFIRMQHKYIFLLKQSPWFKERWNWISWCNTLISASYLSTLFYPHISLLSFFPSIIHMHVLLLHKIAFFSCFKLFCCFLHSFHFYGGLYGCNVCSLRGLSREITVLMPNSSPIIELNSSRMFESNWSRIVNSDRKEL